MVKRCHRLPKETVDASSPDVLKAGMDGTLGSLVQQKVSLSTAEAVELDGLKDPFQPKMPYDFMRGNKAKG